jgi:hypothetical protein
MACSASEGPVRESDPTDILDASPDVEPIAPPDDDAEARAAPFAPCSTDADCVAVPRVGCCHLGWKVAVNRRMAEAYTASFLCPNPRPICIQMLVIDRRCAVCEWVAHQCRLVQPPECR